VRAALSLDDDATLAGRIALKDQTAFEQLMRRHNGRLFRVSRSILKDDAEAEDALQDAYLEAYKHIADFRGDAQIATWLTRIVVNQALMRLRKQKRHRNVVPIAGADRSREDETVIDVPDTRAESPRDALFRAEVRKMIERRIDELPLNFRTVFVMREVEDLSVQETAACLAIPEATVRTRLFRARALMRESLARDMDMAATDAFAFAGGRCDRIVANVLARVSTLN
jgi:RNA polymerase sigma-70 factor (ECF subfamily)